MGVSNGDTQRPGKHKLKEKGTLKRRREKE
jgi:hypothetical protein